MLVIYSRSEIVSDLYNIPINQHLSNSYRAATYVNAHFSGACVRSNPIRTRHYTPFGGFNLFLTICNIVSENSQSKKSLNEHH